MLGLLGIFELLDALINFKNIDPHIGAISLLFGKVFFDSAQIVMMLALKSSQLGRKCILLSSKFILLSSKRILLGSKFILLGGKLILSDDDAIGFLVQFLDH